MHELYEQHDMKIDEEEEDEEEEDEDEEENEDEKNIFRTKQS